MTGMVGGEKVGSSGERSVGDSSSSSEGYVRAQVISVSARIHSSLF
jgi:hypothetical protein